MQLASSVRTWTCVRPPPRSFEAPSEFGPVRTAGMGPDVGLTIPPPADHLEPDVVPRARQRGLVLVERELDTGQVVWAWQSAEDAPAPHFLTRREALAWMASYLDRTPAARPDPEHYK